MACQTDAMDAEAVTGALADIDVLMNEMVYHPDDPAATLTHSKSSIQLANISMSDSQPTNAPYMPPELLDILASVAHCPADDLSPSQSLVAIGVDSITAIGVSAKCKKSWSDDQRWGHRFRLHDRDATVPQDEVLSLQIPTEEYQAILERFPERRCDPIVSVSVATEGMKWLVAAWQRSFGQRFHHVFAYRLSPDVNIQQL